MSLFKGKIFRMTSRSSWNDGEDKGVPLEWADSLYSFVRYELFHSAWFNYDSNDEKWLVTSPVLNCKLDGDTLHLHTQNSIYTFDVVK